MPYWGRIAGPMMQAAFEPLDNVIPVSTLSLGAQAANAFPGFTSPTTTVSASGGGGVTDKVINPNPDNDSLVCQSNRSWRDYQVTTYTGRGAIYLRVAGANGSQSGFVFAYNGAVTGGDIRVGIVTGMDTTSTSEPYLGGTPYIYYVNTNVAASPEGIAAGFTNTWTHGNNFTFGINGFTVYLQWNGIDIIRYTEWRLMQFGIAAVWTHSTYGATDISLHYFATQNLFSNPSYNIYDPRDFGMRNVAAVKGNMIGGTNQLVLNSQSTFQVGDQIIVEIGGESGGGLRGSIGVGGTWPALNYPSIAAMNADTSQAINTFCYNTATSPYLAYIFYGGATGWANASGGGGGEPGSQSYYTSQCVPLSLIAKITAISQDAKTLTLSINAATTTSNANIWLDCLPSMYVLNQVPIANATTAPTPNNVTLAIPSSQNTGGAQWCFSGVCENTNAVTSGFWVRGSGKSSTTIRNPKGVTCAGFDIGQITVNNVEISDLTYQGNHGANGFMFNITGPNTFFNYPVGIVLTAVNANTGFILKNIDCYNNWNASVQIQAAAGALISNCNIFMQTEQFDYNEWQVSLDGCTAASQMINCQATGQYLLKSFEMFACYGGCSIVNCGGTNCLYSTNSSDHWTIDFGPGQTTVCTIQALSWVNQLSGAIDEAIINVNDNAFHTGNTGLINNPNINQQGYIDATSNSLKFIQVSSEVPNVTIQGEYPGSGGCSTILGGIMQAPNYVGTSAEYGAMAVYADGATCIVNGIRIKGSAIGSPGHSGHFGNISLGGATSQVNNCVADVIQSGPTLSGNQTNLAYGNC